MSDPFEKYRKYRVVEATVRVTEITIWTPDTRHPNIQVIKTDDHQKAVIIPR